MVGSRRAEIPLTDASRADMPAQPGPPSLFSGWWSGRIHGTGSRYSNIARRAADPNSSAFSTFRSVRAYTDIVSHNTVELYQPHLDALCSSHTDLVSERLWSSLVLIDAIGGPQRSLVEACNGTRRLGLATGAMVRFICTIGRMLDTFGQLRVPKAHTRAPFDGWEVCEIGGGFAGMAHAVLSYSKGRARYRIFDLPEAAALQRRILSAVGWRQGEHFDALSIDFAAPPPEPACDLVYSSYALTELTASLQLSYVRHLLSRARVGAFIVVNSRRVDFLPPMRDAGFASVVQAEIHRPRRAERFNHIQALFAPGWNTSYGHHDELGHGARRRNPAGRDGEAPRLVHL